MGLTCSCGMAGRKPKANIGSVNERERPENLRSRDKEEQRKVVSLRGGYENTARSRGLYLALEENKTLTQKLEEKDNEIASILSESDEEIERLQSQLREQEESVCRERAKNAKLNGTIERLMTETCHGRDCTSHYLRGMNKSISDSVETIKRAINELRNEQRSLLRHQEELIIHVQQQQHQQQQQLDLLQQQQQLLLLLQQQQQDHQMRQEQQQQLHLNLLQQQQQQQQQHHEQQQQQLHRILQWQQWQQDQSFQQSSQLHKEQEESQVQQREIIRTPGRDMDKQRVVGHDQLIQEFETLTTDPDGLLGVLENALCERSDDGVHGDEANFEAKKLLCALFQKSYNKCKEEVIKHATAQFGSLFEVQSAKTEEMEDTSRGYGMLLSACGLRTDRKRDEYSTSLKKTIYSDISSNETLQKVKETLERSDEDHLGKVIELAWKFVTLPNPLIVCQPKAYNPRIHDPEHGHWDGEHTKEFELTYVRPVVYRNYEGVLARKGWVSNTATSHQSYGLSTYLLSYFY